MDDTGQEWWYELDADDRLVAVGGEWDAFAQENGAPGAVRAQVTGRSFFAFVAGMETAHLLRRILQAVRAGTRTIEVPFRCDGPGVQRFMNFRGEPLRGGGVRVTTRLLRELPLDAAPPAGAPDPDAMIAMCSWCNRIRVHEGAWLEVAEAAAHLGLFLAPAPPAITHGLCGACLEAMEPLLDDQRLPAASSSGATGPVG
jgi:hypothetical protein